MRRSHSFDSCAVLALLLLSSAAAAAPVQNLVVRSIARDGSSVREVRADADVAAGIPQLAAVLMSHDEYSRFMPYVRECRVLEHNARAERLVYVRLQLPWLAPRDYVVREWTEPRDFRKASDEFEDHWVAMPDALPGVAGVVRLRRDEGSWRLWRNADGSTHVQYRFTVDPGGALPPFLVNLGNEQGVGSTLDAVVREAQRRASLARH